MTREAWLEAFDAAPPAVQYYLLDTASAQNESAAQLALGYEHDAWDRIMDVVWEAVFLGLPRLDFSAKIKALSFERDPRQVEAQVLLHIVYPLADLLSWDIDARLQELGIPASVLAGKERISLRPVSYGAAVRRIATKAGISLLGEELIRRLREQVEAYLRGDKTLEQMKEPLRRLYADGGVGFSEDQLNRFLAAMEALLKTTHVISENEYARWLEQSAREKEAERLEQAREKRREEDVTPVRAAPKTPTTAIQQAVEEICTAIQIETFDEYLAKRLRSLIETRLRHVRNVDQVRDILSRDPKVGGVGLNGEALDRAVAMIERIHETMHDRIEAEEKAEIEAQKQRQIEHSVVRKAEEEQARKAWFEEKKQEGLGGETASVQALRDLMQGKAPAATSRVTGVPIWRLDAVQGDVRLMSLTDELGQMSLERFRRLGRTPEESFERLQQKFQALKQESFERWTEGIARWRSSPLQQAYLGLVSRAFGRGTPVAELANEEHEAQASALSSEEVAVLMELNQQLQA